MKINFKKYEVGRDVICSLGHVMVAVDSLYNGHRCAMQHSCLCIFMKQRGLLGNIQGDCHNIWQLHVRLKSRQRDRLLVFSRHSARIVAVDFPPNFRYFAPLALFCDCISKNKLNICRVFAEGIFGDVWKVVAFDLKKLTSDLGTSGGLTSDDRESQLEKRRNSQNSWFLQKCFMFCTVNAFIDIRTSS